MSQTWNSTSIINITTTDGALTKTTLRTMGGLRTSRRRLQQTRSAHRISQSDVCSTTHSAYYCNQNFSVVTKPWHFRVCYFTIDGPIWRMFALSLGLPCCRRAASEAAVAAESSGRLSESRPYSFSNPRWFWSPHPSQLQCVWPPQQCRGSVRVFVLAVSHASIAYSLI